MISEGQLNIKLNIKHRKLYQGLKMAIAAIAVS